MYENITRSGVILAIPCDDRWAYDDIGSSREPPVPIAFAHLYRNVRARSTQQNDRA